MREFGYIEGKNFVMEWRFADGKYERFPELAAELVNQTDAAGHDRSGSIAVIRAGGLEYPSGPGAACPLRGT
jgi:hypothetical protein